MNGSEFFSVLMSQNRDMAPDLRPVEDGFEIELIGDIAKK